MMNISPVEAGSAVQGSSVVAAVPRPEINVRTEAKADGKSAVKSEQVKRMVEEINSQLRKMNVSLEFSRYGENGGKVAVVIADKETGEVIREIPSKEMQRLSDSINDLAGVIFNDQA
jgi:flagellar protein FlaG